MIFCIFQWIFSFFLPFFRDVSSCKVRGEKHLHYPHKTRLFSRESNSLLSNHIVNSEEVRQAEECVKYALADSKVEWIKGTKILLVFKKK